jgi:hypothetical protein
MKRIYSILSLCALLVGFTHTATACDESSATQVGDVTANANGSFTIEVDVCSEYIGLEGNPYELIFTFSPASINILNFTPASYDTSYPDTYTGSANGNVLTYDGVFLPVHNAETLCNTFSITFEGEGADELSIQTNDYPSPQCTHTIALPDISRPECVLDPIKANTLIAIPLGIQGAVSEEVGGFTYAPFYDAYLMSFVGGVPPYSYSGSLSSNAVKYSLDKPNNKLTIYGPVSSTWEIIVTDSRGCTQVFPRPDHVVPVIDGETTSVYVSDYTFTPATSNSASNGAIDITPYSTQNTPAYSFTWMAPLGTPFAATEDISSVRKKTYFLSLDDGASGFLCAFILPVQSGKDEVADLSLLFDEVANTNVSIYPNPVSDKAYVNITTNEVADAMVELYNINGQKVATIFEGTLNATNQFSFSTENLSNGLYFVKTTSSTGFQDAYKIQVLK